MRLSHLWFSALVFALLPSPASGNSLFSRIYTKIFGTKKQELFVTTVKPTSYLDDPQWESPFTTKTPVDVETATTSKDQWTTNATKEIASPNCGVFPPKRQRFARVIGGYEAPRGSHPYVGMVRFHKQWQCGASLVHPKFILTAAHCVDDSSNPNDFDSVFGVFDRAGDERTAQTVGFRKIHIHPKFKDTHARHLEHDIALVELTHNLTLNQHVALVCLPDKDSNLYDGRLCFVNGWGKEDSFSSSDKLRAAVVPIVDRETCTQPPSGLSYRDLPSSAFCAGYHRGGVDTCQGDSGGPFVCQESNGVMSLAGVTSWGIGCAMKHNPGVYTKVASYRDWIDEIIEDGERVDDDEDEEGFF